MRARHPGPARGRDRRRPGGTGSWHGLALHIVARHASPGEALRIAKVYLLELHTEGQLPYRALVRGSLEADAAVRSAQAFLEARFRDDRALADAVAHVGVPERTLKRRFKAATGTTLIAYLQNLRIEEAKRSLESSSLPVEEVSVRGGGAVPPGRGQGCSWAGPRRLASIGAATARAPRSSRILVASAVPGRGRHGRR